jgi:hypothetical protein
MGTYPGGDLGANTMALELNYLYSAHSIGIFGPDFCSLTFYNTSASLDGKTILDVLNIANQVVAGNTVAIPSGYNINSWNALLAQINIAFSSDLSWASAHLY